MTERADCDTCGGQCKHDRPQRADPASNPIVAPGGPTDHKSGNASRPSGTHASAEDRADTPRMPPSGHTSSSLGITQGVITTHRVLPTMQPKPCYSEGPFAELERLIRDPKNAGAAEAIVRHMQDQRQFGTCFSCGELQNPGHSVQAGGWCACDYSAACYQQPEGHVPRHTEEELYDRDETTTTCCECSVALNAQGEVA